MKMIWYIFLNVLFPLFIGLLCYMFLRPEAFIPKMVFFYTGLWVSLPSETVYGNLILRFLNNHFADFLWAYAMSHLIFAYGCYIEWNKKLLLMLCVGTGIIMECLMGTFDFVDIFMQWLAISIAYYKYKSINEMWRKKYGK